MQKSKQITAPPSAIPQAVAPTQADGEPIAYPDSLEGFEGPEELFAIWCPDVKAEWRRLQPKQQDFLKAYIRTGNGTTAYLEVYNPKASRHVANNSASLMLNRTNLRPILDKIRDRKRMALDLVHNTWVDMAEANIPEFVRDPASGEMVNAGYSPDWNSRDKACKGLNTLYALSAPAKVVITDPAGQAIPMHFAQQFNFFLTQKGMNAIPIGEEEEDEPGPTSGGNVPTFSEFLKA